MAQYSISLDLSLREYLRLLRMRFTQSDNRSYVSLIVPLIESGCDYFELLDLYSEIPISEEMLRVFMSFSPKPLTVLPITILNIRENISRWNPSKYHSGTINDTVLQIYNLLINGNNGITVFNSNNNPNLKKKNNNKYVLLIMEQHKHLIDINRKRIIQFIN